jgi:hypothetical protein
MACAATVVEEFNGLEKPSGGKPGGFRHYYTTVAVQAAQVEPRTCSGSVVFSLAVTHAAGARMSSKRRELVT